MEFKTSTTYEITERLAQDSPISKIYLRSTQIISDNNYKPMKNNSYVNYCIVINGGNAYCSVSTKPSKDGKYLIHWYSLNCIGGTALETFIEYLKENHKKNIMELML